MLQRSRRAICQPLSPGSKRSGCSDAACTTCATGSRPRRSPPGLLRKTGGFKGVIRAVEPLVAHHLAIGRVHSADSCASTSTPLVRQWARYRTTTATRSPAEMNRSGSICQVSPPLDHVVNGPAEGGESMTSAGLYRVGRVHVFDLRVEEARRPGELVACPSVIDPTHDLHVLPRHRPPSNSRRARGSRSVEAQWHDRR